MFPLQEGSRVKSSKMIGWSLLALLCITGFDSFLWTCNAASLDQGSAVQDFIVEKDKNDNVLISYSITKPVYLILRVYSTNPSLILLKQILIRALRNPGRYTEVWDGKDESGHYIDKWQVSVRTEPVELLPEASQEMEGIKAILPSSNAMPLNHYLHEPSKCGIFNLRFTNIGDGYHLSGTYNVTLEAQGFYGYTKDIGVNLRVFIDSTLVNERSIPFDEINELTFDVPINTSDLLPGKHLLRAVIFDYADHYGTTSVEFIKE